MSEPGKISGERAMDSQAFEALVRQHHRRLLGYALALVPVRQVAEDLVQETFLTAYRERSRFETDRDFGAWARGILRNKYREWARRQREIPTDAATLNAIDEQHALWDRVEAAPGELLGALQDCIRKLPEVLRQVVDLFYMQRKPGAEVASNVSCDAATVRKRLQRAREQLAACVASVLGRETVRSPQ